MQIDWHKSLKAMEIFFALSPGISAAGAKAKSYTPEMHVPRHLSILRPEKLAVVLTDVVQEHEQLRQRKAACSMEPAIVHTVEKSLPGHGVICSTKYLSISVLVSRNN